MSMPIISSDSHVDIKRERVLEHLPQRFHDDYDAALQAQVQRMLNAKPQKRVKNKAGGGGEAVDLGAMASGTRPHPAFGRPGAHDPYERLKDMDIDKVDAEILYTNIN